MTEPRCLTIHVLLLSLLKRFAPADSHRFDLALEAPACIDDLTRHLAIPGDVVRIALKNGKWAEGSTLLADGDAVTLMPPVDGG